MFDLKSLDGTKWLCEPKRLELAILRVASMRPCPSTREVVRLRRERLEEAGQACARALDASGIDFPEEEQLAAGGKQAIRAANGRVGVIPIHGPVSQRMDAALEKAGGTSLEEVGVAFDALMRDKSIGAIILHTDSPGGSSYGTEELADKIYSARGQKPVYACADSMAASAAYWIATSAAHLSVTTGGDVGSVGVYAVHIDESKAMEAQGVKVTLVTAGKYKAEYAPFSPLTDEAAAHMQEEVDGTYSRFLDGLKRNRGVSLEQVRRDFGQGRLVNAEEAVKLGMADRVLPFEELLMRVRGMPGGSGDGRAAAVSVGILRLRQEQQKRQGTSGYQQFVRGVEVTRE